MANVKIPTTVPKDIHGWISCDDLLPPDGEEVLAYRNGRIGVGRMIEVNAEKDRRIWGFNGTSGGPREMMKFQYWMRLPYIPEAEAADMEEEPQ